MNHNDRTPVENWRRFPETILRTWKYGLRATLKSRKLFRPADCFDGFDYSGIDPEISLTGII